MKEKVIGTLFFIGLTLCGCGVESVFGTPEQRATWIAVCVVTIVAAFWLKDR